MSAYFSAFRLLGYTSHFTLERRLDEMLAVVDVAAKRGN
jgi:hypothetical protein